LVEFHQPLGNYLRGAVIHTDYPGKDFDAGSFTTIGQAVTLDLDAQVKDMDWTSVTNTPTITGAFAFKFDVVWLGNIYA